MPKKTIFITGTTGSMGSAALLELLERRDRFEIVTLVRPSRSSPWCGRRGRTRG
jgi:thioester reductase-like protein